MKSILGSYNLNQIAFLFSNYIFFNENNASNIFGLVSVEIG